MLLPGCTTDCQWCTVCNVCIWSGCRLVVTPSPGLETLKLELELHKTAQWACCYVSHYGLPFLLYKTICLLFQHKKVQLTLFWPGWLRSAQFLISKNIGFKLKIDFSTTLAHYWGKLLLKIHRCTYEKQLPHLTSEVTLRFLCPPGAASTQEHRYVLNRNCWERRCKITPAGSESHADISFFLSSQPVPRSLHSHQIFFYSDFRGKRRGRLCRAGPHWMQTRSTPL